MCLWRSVGECAFGGVSVSVSLVVKYVILLRGTFRRREIVEYV